MARKNTLDVSECEDLMNRLNLNNSECTEEEYIENYFNAWNFGVQEEDCKFILCAALS